MDTSRSYRERNPDQALAQLVKDRLDVEIEPGRLRKFMLDNWSRLNVLSHAIHNDEKATANGG